MNLNIDQLNINLYIHWHCSIMFVFKNGLYSFQGVSYLIILYLRIKEDFHFLMANIFPNYFSLNILY